MPRFVTASIWIIGLLAGLFLLAFIGLVIFLSVTRYRPAPVEQVEIKGNQGRPVRDNQVFTFFSWNIGYAGLGREMDFFYEGGKRVKPEHGEFQKYLNGILEMIRAHDSIDFIFIQEADIHSKRSYYTDESEEIAGVLKDHCFAFARNYDCRYVPVPVFGAMGRVVSGIISFSHYRPDSVTRFDFGTQFSWPQRLVFLNRCFMAMRFRLECGKELIVVNTHNSVFDEKGDLRKKELEKLNDFMSDEYEKGNFVIAGGDWNQNPRGFTSRNIKTGDKVKEIALTFADDIFKGWQFAFDPGQSTNRDVDMHYRKGITQTTIIDFYVVSPNIKVESVKTISSGFENSDHQPVIMKVKILK
jgi:endonuclease/exonuclease/phosphatase family metal-dependent hydrolase